MWESPQSLIASMPGPQNLSFFPSFSSQIPFSLCSFNLKSYFLSLFFSAASPQLSHSLPLSFEKRLCEQVRACQKRVNHRYECIHILDFCTPCQKGR